MGTGLKLREGKLVTTARGGLALTSGAVLITERIARLLRTRRGELESHPDWGNPAFEEKSAPANENHTKRWTNDLRAVIESDPGVKRVSRFELRRLGERTWHLRITITTDHHGEQGLEVTF